MSLRPSMRRTVAACACALALLALAGPAAALTTRCVGTSQQLSDALAEASKAVADSLFVIKVREGTYTSTTSAPFELSMSRWEQLVEISGGWSGDGGACEHTNFDPSATTIAGSAAKRGLYFTFTTAFGQHLYLHDVTFTNAQFAEAAGGACVFGSVMAGSIATVERVLFDDCRAPNGEHAAAQLVNAGELTLRNVAVRSGTAAYNGGLLVYTHEAGTSHIAQVSVTGTQSTDAGAFGSGIVLMDFESAMTRLSNSVSWDNDVDGPDIWVHGPSVVLERVHYGSLGGTPDANIAPGIGDPGFVAPGNPRPRPDSELVDSGVGTPAGGSGTFDADGHPRVQGAAVDVGAYEAAPAPDAIFDDGFDAT
ncbi:MAG TPA: choice-of-anchor Q domain-containing protein [Dokdonella sp.]